MSWRFVFNSTVGDIWWGDADTAFKAAKQCGYQFFTWGGYVYSICGDIYMKTSIGVEDLV